MSRELTLSSLDEVFRGSKPVILTSPRTLQVFDFALTIPTIEFVTPESLWHFRLRRFKSWHELS